MTRRATWTIAVTGLAVIAVAGCAKHPVATPTAAAPAPSGTPSGIATPARMAPAFADVARSGSGTSASHAGATATARPNPAEFTAQAALRDVHFDFDRSEIRPADQPVLDADATWLNAHMQQAILIEGHADERGTSEYNLALGERRARATRDYLVGHGVAAARISIVSYGFERPVCTEHSETCWAQNRRSHFMAKAE